MKYEEKLLHIDLFSGIGGFALAADRVFGEVEHIFCDNDAFCREVLKKHWPESRIFGDIRTLTKNTLSIGRPLGEYGESERVGNKRKFSAGDDFGVHILTGGFPCQPFSQAGRRRGEEDDRFLWPEMLRVIREFSPLWVIAENVRGLLTQGGGVVFERVCTDLEAAGYEVQPLIIPAVAVGAPHRRDRVWFVAHRKSFNEERSERQGNSRGEPKETIGDGNSSAPDTKRNGSRPRRAERKRLKRTRTSVSTGWNEPWLTVATRLCRVDDGLPRRMDRNPRLKALGNAIVPQVAEEIMRAIAQS